METRDFNVPERDLSAKLSLLQKEYTRRVALAREDRTVASLRLQEAARLLCGGKVTRQKAAPEALFSPLRERYTAFLAPLLRECDSPAGAFALRRELCSALADLLLWRRLPGEEKFFSAERHLKNKPGEKIAFLRNRFAQEAYTGVYAYLAALSCACRETKSAPQAMYVGNFPCAAELLIEGRCTGLLFPYETEDGHPLPSVEALIEAYDLKKAAVCPLSSRFGGASYVLLRRGLCFTEESRLGDFRLPKNEEADRALYELPLFAAMEGLTTERVEVLLPGRREETLLRFLFRQEEPVEKTKNARQSMKKNPLLRMFFYLSMEYPGFTAGGFYHVLPLTVDERPRP